MPVYPVKSSTQERANETRGPVESMILPTNGAELQVPTVREAE